MDAKLTIEEKSPVRVVLIGGGVGGTSAANRLARVLRGRASVELVTASPFHLYEPGLVHVPFDDLPVVETERPERELVGEDVALVPEDPAVRIDLAARTVLLRSGLQVSYDYLVLCTGSEPDLEKIPGFREGAHHLSTRSSAEALHYALFRFAGGKIVVGAAAPPHKHPQAQAELCFLLADYLERTGLAGRSEITYVYPLDRVFPEPAVASFLAARLDARGIKLRTSFHVVAVAPDQHRLFGKGGLEQEYDLLVLTPPQRGAAVIRDSGLGDAEGWLPTEPGSLRLVGAKDVWVVGDCSDLPVGRSPSAADHQARVVAEAIVADFEGRAPRPRLASYDGREEMFVELGQGFATLLEGDYEHPLAVHEPSRAFAAGKRAFDAIYWQLVPTGIL